MGSVGHSCLGGSGSDRTPGPTVCPWRAQSSPCRQGVALLFWVKSGSGVIWALARQLSLFLSPGESELKPRGTRHQKGSLVSTKVPTLSVCV